MTHFTFFLIPGFSLVALSCAIDTLRAANVELGEARFSWALLGEDDAPITSSSGISLPCSRYDLAQPDGPLALCGGERSHLYSHAGVDNWLRAEARKDRVVGSLSDGAYVAARAGLFDRVPSTIHWKCLSAYRELYPKLDIRSSIFEVSERRFSCAGGTASLDLILHFVSQTLDDRIAGRIADNYFHDVIRGDDQVQQMAGAFRFAARNGHLSKALHLMEANLEEPLSIGQIANEIHQSHQQLDRLFRKYLNASPAEHYRDLRLHRASGLLKQSGLSVTEIAQSCGFHSASHLSKFFVRKFNVTPSHHRRAG